MTPAERLARFVEQGGIVRRSWGDGEHTACLLSAQDPACAKQHRSSACSDDVLPPWMATLTPILTDGISDKNFKLYVRRYSELAFRWQGLPDDAWDSILFALMHYTVCLAKALLPPGYADAFVAAPPTGERRILAYVYHEGYRHEWYAVDVINVAVAVREGTFLRTYDEDAGGALFALSEAYGRVSSEILTWDLIAGVLFSLIEATCDEVDSQRAQP